MLKIMPTTGLALTTQFLPQAAAIISRHLLQAIASLVPFLTQTLALLGWHFLPMFAHFLTHLAALIRLQLRRRIAPHRQQKNQGEHTTQQMRRRSH